MSDFQIAPAARTDLNDIWNYYALELRNINAADRLRDDLFARMRKIAKWPGFGHLRVDISSEPLRFTRVRRYLIIYRSEKRPIEIVRVLHSRRDVKGILEGPDVSDENPIS
jgi:plasmid stabilization system protein ParE